MSGLRTQWHLAELEEAEDVDPFAAVVYSSGFNVDLTGDEQGLAEEYVRLMKVEARLVARRGDCDLKLSGRSIEPEDDAGRSCLTCPHATLVIADARNILCRLGKDQATIMRLYKQHRDERLAPFVELGRLAEEMVELGEIDPVLADFLAGVLV